MIAVRGPNGAKKNTHVPITEQSWSNHGSVIVSKIQGMVHPEKVSGTVLAPNVTMLLQNPLRIPPGSPRHSTTNIMVFMKLQMPLVGRNWMRTALFRESKLVSLFFPWADQPMEKFAETWRNKTSGL